MLVLLLISPTLRKVPVLTKEALQKLAAGLFGADGSKLAGSINLGKVVFDGLHSINGTVSWPYAKQYGVNYLPHYKNDDLMSAQLLDVSGDTVYGHWGSVLDASRTLEAQLPLLTMHL